MYTPIADPHVPPLIIVMLFTVFPSNTHSFAAQTVPGPKVAPQFPALVPFTIPATAEVTVTVVEPVAKFPDGAVHVKLYNSFVKLGGVTLVVPLVATTAVSHFRGAPTWPRTRTRWYCSNLTRHFGRDRRSQGSR